MTESTIPSTPTAPRYVAYYRVSTDKQGKSGLGLEAQTLTVGQHAQRTGGEIIGSFQEVERIVSVSFRHVVYSLRGQYPAACGA